MNDVTARNFGLAIAYLIPGFIGLAGVAAVSDVIRTWLGGDGGPTVGGFLYVSLGSIAAGMTVSAMRWAVIDTIHHFTGLRRPKWDDSKLNERLRAVEHLVDGGLFEVGGAGAGGERARHQHPSGGRIAVREVLDHLHR